MIEHHVPTDDAQGHLAIGLLMQGTHPWWDVGEYGDSREAYMWSDGGDHTFALLVNKNGRARLMHQYEPNAATFAETGGWAMLGPWDAPEILALLAHVRNVACREAM